MTVWLVNIIDEEAEIFGTAEKAYNYLAERVQDLLGSDPNYEKWLEELTEDYKNYPDAFGLEDFGYAVEYTVN